MTDKNASEKSELVKNAEKALQEKNSLPDPAEPRPEARTADEGMNPIPNEGEPPSGALEQEGHRPVLERSRKVR